MNNPKITTIDLTPTWSEILPALLRLYAEGSTSKVKRTAEEELRRMAALADRYVAAQDDLKEAA
ncbi:hypothetical protein [Croceicoccus naphthovorans]|uniref:Uncharacterized protein n=1 Tax=Croceicoccus naphthovorans TaxID=1348774 RepID=A0A0G3XG48_9SPHN|nr:hypothetical protein [Croceicoccus naphthovorans]AKM09368.1 hypothetical protein AB433_04210 [Croceicoccus naphthovorans]MBB3990288.1 hypothetical protein [Croceicoccus naphthovorans]